MSSRISIITPTRNMARFLEPCIFGILGQCYSNVEHIVVDGASTDNTREILGRFPHIRWVSEPDQGLSDALNKGIRMATGDIIGWCNADDIYLPGTFTVVDEILARDSNLDIMYGDYRVIDESGRPLSILRETRFSPAVFRWLHVNMIPTPAAFWRKCIHDQGLWFDEKMRFAMDYDFLRKAYANGHKIKHVSVLFVDFRRHGGSLSAAGGQLGEHEVVVRRDANVAWKRLGPAFPVLRFCFLIAVRAMRTAEKCVRGFYFDRKRR